MTEYYVSTWERAFNWLARKIEIKPNELGRVLAKREDGSKDLYRVEIRKKKSGGIRKIHIPCPELKKVQRKISDNILSNLQPGPNTYGFFGGSIVDTISPHLNSKVIFSLDFIDAFSSVKEKKILESLRETGLGWYVSQFITQLATWELDSKKVALPQGAPTSPKIFDLSCKRMDVRLSRLAEHTDSYYTRYVDNIFFSMERNKVPIKIQRAILRTVGKEEFLYHKVRIRPLNGNTVRMLGLNLIEGKIHNTRAFKRKIRLSLHHIQWLEEHGRDEEVKEVWRRLQGQMAFARIDTLPDSFLDDYLKLIGVDRRENTPLFAKINGQLIKI